MAVSGTVGHPDYDFDRHAAIRIAQRYNISEERARYFLQGCRGPDDFERMCRQYVGIDRPDTMYQPTPKAPATPQSNRKLLLVKGNACN